MKLSPCLAFLIRGTFPGTRSIWPRSTRLAGVPLSVLCAGHLVAQTVVVPAQVFLTGNPPPGVVLPAGVTVLPPDGQPGGAPGQPSSLPGGAPVRPEEAQLQQILQLQFDRRPSAVLQSLATGDPAPGDTNDALQGFRRSVNIGDWPAVAAFLKKLPTNQTDRVYLHVLRGLQRIPQPNPGQPDGEGMPMMMIPGAPRPEPFLLPADVLALSELKPSALTDEDIQALGQLLSRAVSRGNSLDPFLERLAQGTSVLGGTNPTHRLRAAHLLFAAGRPVDAGSYLPPLDSLDRTRDLPLVALHAQSLAAQGTAESRKEALQQAWNVNLEILRTTNAAPAQRKAALNRIFTLLPQVRSDLGTNWLRESFSQRPDEGITILSAVGTQQAQDATNRDIERRRANLELFRRVTDELLTAAPDPQRWVPQLNLLTAAWIQEAEFSRNRHMPRRNRFPQFDQFGNQIFMGDDPGPMMYQDPNQLPPIPVEQVLPTAPDDRWIAHVDPSLAPRLRSLIAELHLKAEDDAKALNQIKTLAAIQPKTATRLANDYLRVWARTHDPNPQTQNMYPRYYYGGMQPSGIPLTRAFQARNLRELAANLSELRKLSLSLDDTAVIAAFSAAHSPAEVFRDEDIERVFGPVDRIPPSTLAGLLQTMRERLAGQWRSGRVQQEAKTKRTDKQLEAEVVRGYELLTSLIDRALQQRPEDWRLNLVRASALFDSAEFDYGKKVDLKVYTEKRDHAFKAFEQAAALYARQVTALPEAEQTPQVFQQWFNATLGASDLAYLTRQTEPDTNHLARVRGALHGLPSPVVGRHVAAFGTALASSMDSIKPELKPRYLRAGLQVVGDHPSVAEVKKVVQHYEDLLQEVALDVRIDGPAEVGHGSPFGVFVAIRYSDALGRESGNFTKYLQNQQGQNFYFNPYGTPPVNYRDDFEKQVREKWDPGFEILAVTFHDEKVEPRGFGRDGWRETPYAYVLLKAKDASVDRLPPLRLDLDFVDRRGPVILPTQSQVQLLDARPDKVSARPLEGVECVQILDDREAAQGRLGLEIKATGQGLLPEMDELLDLSLPGFRVEKKTAAPLTITRLDATGDVAAPVSERNLVLNLVPESQGNSAAVFRFPASRRPGMTNLYKRYADADIVEVKPEVAVDGLRLRPAVVWPWAAGSVVFLAVFGVGFARWRRLRPSAAPKAPLYSVPDNVTPFSVLKLLQRLQADPALALSAERRLQLATDIRDLESRHFSPGASSDGRAHLESVARQWVTAVEKVSGTPGN